MAMEILRLQLCGDHYIFAAMDGGAVGTPGVFKGYR